MGFNATVLTDSISPAGVRLTTLEVTFWRAILAEFNTHRAFTRSSASSRAIPVDKIISRVESDPFTPIYWGANQSGMVAEQELPPEIMDQAEREWLAARNDAVRHARNLHALGVHKQHANRLLEPFMWHTVICTASEFSNFLALRAHPEAQPEIQRTAILMRKALDESTPILVPMGDWHLPLVSDREQLEVEGFDVEEIKKVSAGRCARVSYLTHLGVRDPRADIDLASRLVSNGHMSPLEHVATPLESAEPCGNFKGWRQLRKDIPHEADFGMRNP